MVGIAKIGQRFFEWRVRPDDRETLWPVLPDLESVRGVDAALDDPDLG